MSSYLPLGREEEVARKKAIAGIIEMAGEHFPHHLIDADEMPDPLLAHDFEAGVVDDTMNCLTFNCLGTLLVCATCPLCPQQAGSQITDDISPYMESALLIGKARII